MPDLMADFTDVFNATLKTPPRFRDVSAAYDLARRVKAAQISKLKKFYK